MLSEDAKRKALPNEEGESVEVGLCQVISFCQVLFQLPY